MAVAPKYANVKSIRIGHVDYQLSFHTDILEYEENKSAWGLHDAFDDSIKIVLQKGNTNTPNTIIHEILHALFDEYGVNIEEEERTVTVLANGLTAVIRDNPELFDMLFKQIKGK